MINHKKIYNKSNKYRLPKDWVLAHTYLLRWRYFVIGSVLRQSKKRSPKERCVTSLVQFKRKYCYEPDSEKWTWQSSQRLENNQDGQTKSSLGSTENTS